MEAEPVMTDQPAVHRWGRWEGTFESATDYDNPMQDVDLRATLTSPAGVEHQDRGFWDGGRTWRVRFSPDEVGEWRYQLATPGADDSGLNGVSGNFTVTEYSG